MDRTIVGISEPPEVGEGTGARMKRLLPDRRFGPYDPIVLLDEFYVPPDAGLPEHPHKGFEIITYMLSGGLHHKDSLGVDHVARAGGVMRISCNRGIYHSEFPDGDEPAHGLQLWINLPRARKQLEPSFASLEADEVPEESGDGVKVRYIAGDDTSIQLETPLIYRHVRLEPGATWTQEVSRDYAGVIYVLDGGVHVGPDGDATQGSKAQGLFMKAGEDQGEQVTVRAAGDEGADFALIAGRPHGEPIRMQGPFVL